MSPATAEILPTELFSEGLSIGSAATIGRNDLGIFALFITCPVPHEKTSKKLQLTQVSLRRIVMR